MPLQAPITTYIFFNNLSASNLNGLAIPQMSLGLAMGLENYANKGLTAQSADVGTIGVGKGVGIGFLVTAQVLSAAFYGTFLAHNILGIASPSVINALALSFNQCFLGAAITTNSATVGIGTGIVKAVTDTKASKDAFEAGMKSGSILGSASSRFIQDVAEGLDIALNTGVGAIVIGGAPSIIPSAGSSSGNFS
jgi:uncharacterized membrane protein (DUF485 family)